MSSTRFAQSSRATGKAETSSHTTPQEFALALESLKGSPDDTAPLLSPVEIRLEPFQERLLELIAVARQQGHHRNLLVSATGTGKTVMAAVDYARLAPSFPARDFSSWPTARRF